MEHTNSSVPPHLVSNDMYPVKDEKGQTIGIVEIAHSRQQEVKTAQKIVGLSAEYKFDDIVGSSIKMQEQIHLSKEFAKSSYGVLITGESGVGKELFAQSIHNYSIRWKGPFVAINCANFPENLVESELFGYVGGAFTGASKKGGIGKFELADRGTLFLDEVGDLPYHFQSKLLRVLETKRITRIGSSHEIPVDVRVIAATNRDLKTMVEDGFFREDLYFRLQVLCINVPPLRERKDDLFQLAEVMLMQAKDPHSDAVKFLSDNAKLVLLSYDWPGNVRELRNVLSRASILSGSDEISEETLMNCIGVQQNEKQNMLMSDQMIKAELPFEEVYATYLNKVLDESTEKGKDEMTNEIKACKIKFYKTQLETILNFTNGNKKKAAEIMGVSRKTFYNMMEKLNI